MWGTVRHAEVSMADYGPSDYGSPYGSRRNFAADVKPHVYDPATMPELFAGVLPRRVVAFVIDMIIITIPLILAWIFIFIFGLITFGLGWHLFWLLSPGSVVWALFYYGSTLGSAASATIGMRAMGLQMRTWYGAPAYSVLGAVHPIVFWISVTMLSPLILVVGLVNARSRLLHDMLVGVVIINKQPLPYASSRRY
jgi:uncharacterized RDD family membrane protein YckC